MSSIDMFLKERRSYSNIKKAKHINRPYEKPIKRTLNKTTSSDDLLKLFLQKEKYKQKIDIYYNKIKLYNEEINLCNKEINDIEYNINKAMKITEIKPRTDAIQFNNIKDMLIYIIDKVIFVKKECHDKYYCKGNHFNQFIDRFKMYENNTIKFKQFINSNRFMLFYNCIGLDFNIKYIDDFNKLIDIFSIELKRKYGISDTNINLIID